MKIAAYTSVCEEDAQWFEQYLNEVARLNVDFVVHFDRCSEETKRLFKLHPNLVGHTEQNDPAIEFNETQKQGMMDILSGLKYDWIMAWDVDETWEKDFVDKIKVLETIEADYIDLPWVNLWGDKYWIRKDGVFAGGHRVKFYRMGNWGWYFDHAITNGAKHKKVYQDDPDPVLGKIDLICIHHGMMTQELRELHKARWDRIYGAAVGANPYGFWNAALDEENIVLEEFDKCV